jgi:lipoprotein-releasing system ATP-binding protein
MPDLVVENLTKSYPTPGGDLSILDGVTFSLDRGQNIAVLGPSGCGKSTLLHLLGALDVPTRGTIRLDGDDPFQLNPHRLAAFRNRKIGYVFQEHHLLPQLSALDNVLLPMMAEGSVGIDAIQRGKSLLESVGLNDRLDHRPGELSGGERQRVAVARALINQPVLLLADEPTGSLDENNATAIGQLLLDLQTQSQTILICVTHSQRLADLFQQRSRLVGGKLV